MYRKYDWPTEPETPVIFPFQPSDRDICGTGYTAATRIYNAANIKRLWSKLPYQPRLKTTKQGIKFWWESLDGKM